MIQQGFTSYQGGAPKETPMPEVHDLSLNGPLEFGVGEWICYVCGRRVFVKHSAGLETIVVSQGNVYANHSFVTGNKRVVITAVKSDLYHTSLDDEWLKTNYISWGDGDG